MQANDALRFTPSSLTVKPRRGHLTFTVTGKLPPDLYLESTPGGLGQRPRQVHHHASAQRRPHSGKPET